MDPRALAEFILTTLDGTYGPGDEGYIDAGPEDGQYLITYADDEFGVKTMFHMTLEVVE
jgi:hypothetical protein